MHSNEIDPATRALLFRIIIILFNYYFLSRVVTRVCSEIEKLTLKGKKNFSIKEK